MAKGIITEEQVIQHIRTHMDIWCKNYGSHVLEKHVNIPEKTLLSRIGTTEVFGFKWEERIREQRRVNEGQKNPGAADHGPASKSVGE